MVDALIDTSIIVDILRGYQPAIEWMDAKRQMLGVSRLVVLEVLEGVQNRPAQKNAIAFIAQFTIIEPELPDFIWATQALINYGLSYQIDTVDYLIAAVSPRLNLPLFTRNLKHFRPI